jgi:uncharacterized membrane protein
MIKKNLKTLILTSVITLLPIIAGLILWDKLPEQMPMHFDINGDADGYASKTFAVFGFPLIMTALQWLCSFLTGLDPKMKNFSKKTTALVLWIIPALSLLLHTIIYAYALGKEFNTITPIILFFGLFFVITGNYMPKLSQSYTVGIKFPWTLNSEANWIYTHRISGKIWVVGGLILIATSFLNLGWLYLTIFAIMIAVPVIASYRFHKKENKQ